MAVVAGTEKGSMMAMQDIQPGTYTPDLIPQSADGPQDAAYNTETGYLTPYDVPMSEDQFRYTVYQAIQDAQTYIDSYIAPEREQAMAYYLAEPLGNEEQGRSQIVMTEVRDTYSRCFRHCSESSQAATRFWNLCLKVQRMLKPQHRQQT